MRLLGGLLLFLSLFFCLPSLANIRCETVHKSQILILDHQAIGVSQKMPAAHFERFGQDTDSPTQGLRIFDTASGRRMGQVEYYYFPSDRVIAIHNIQVLKEFREAGVGQAMINAIHQTSMRVESVEAILALTNFAVFKRVVRNTGDMIEAIKATPFYRQNAKHGFTEIEIVSREPAIEIVRQGEITISLWKKDGTK